jgi:hypothetical protein
VEAEEVVKVFDFIIYLVSPSKVDDRAVVL